MKLINFGSLNIDYVYAVPHFVRPGETLSSTVLTVNCGGKGLNQSIAVCRAGIPVVHAGCIGQEGLFLKQKLDSAGVDTASLRIVEEKTGHAIIQVDDAGQNCILLYSGANRVLDEQYVDEVLASADKDDVILLQNETSAVSYIVDKASEMGLRIAMNAAPSDHHLDDVALEKLTWLFVNESEGAFLSDCNDPNAMISVLSARYPHTCIVLTLGGDGSCAHDAYGTVTCPIFHTPVVDTTAAGDTFTGYFLRAAMDGKTLEEQLRFASAASAIAISRPGAADSVPVYGEVVEFLNTQA